MPLILYADIALNLKEKWATKANLVGREETLVKIYQITRIMDFPSQTEAGLRIVNFKEF